MTRILPILLIMAGCATVPASGIREVELSTLDLWRVCDNGDRRELGGGTNGCYRMSGKVCTIYTLTKTEWERRGRACKYKAVKRHELKHCAEGDWHGNVATSEPCAPGD